MSKPAAAPAVTARSRTVDDYIALDALVKRFAETAKQHTELRKEIQSWYPDNPEQGFTAQGTKADILISPCATERKVTDLRVLYKIAGVERIRVMLACLTLKVADQLFSDEEKAKFIESGATGSRSLKVVTR